jgi:hypothetical protein
METPFGKLRDSEKIKSEINLYNEINNIIEDIIILFLNILFNKITDMFVIYGNVIGICSIVVMI